jgi:alanyl aminopeptidase
MRGTPTRVIVPRGHLAEAAFAAESFPQLFVELERYFGIPYPFEKLDHIAIPLTVYFAMENVGLITYGMPVLLAKPARPTRGSAATRRTSARTRSRTNGSATW